MHKEKKALYILLLLYTICLILVGCNNSTKKNQSKNSQNQQKKEIASTLSQMEEDTENLIQDLWYKKEYPVEKDREKEEISKEGGKDTSEKENQSKEDQGQSNQQEESKEQNSSNADNKKEDQNEDSKDQGDSEKQDKKSDDDKKQQEQSQNKEDNAKPKSWDDIKKSIEKLHVDWNSYEPEARKDGATGEMIDGIKKQLNILTEKVETKDVDIVLQETNKLYAYYPQFFNLYKHNAPPEIKKMKALTRQIILDAQAQRWNNMDKLLADMKTTWLTARSRMENPDIWLNEKVDCAIDDFAEATKEKRNPLIRLKGDILLQNLEQIK